jgi:hypothetical protein
MRIHTETQRLMAGIYEMGSVAKVNIPSFIKIGSGIQKSVGEGDTQTGWRSHKPILGK